MQNMFWLILFGFALAGGWMVWQSQRKLKALRRAEEERIANFMAGTTGAAAPRAAVPPPATLPSLPAAAPSPVAGEELTRQNLLFDAAHKAGEAGEPALAIQLYARLLARYPATTRASQARAGVEAQKKKLFKS